ncbi:TIGR04388 family protein [Leptospira yasudae]|uniref:TIGR04388 family protein n=1 Tax=Leptospira yasudae TaxID=2202201 RepID=UPI001F4DECA9|nr:TIGR04388 family protein [Leptospira yasudae]
MFNYEAGSGNYTASGGFNIYGDAGLSISAGKDGYASFGLNYNKDGQGWLNNMAGVGLTMGSDGVFTLSHQFKGSDTLNLSYNTNTHAFSPIGVNGNFINDLNLSLIQENAAKGNADAIKKLADYYGNVLVERGVISAEKMGELMTKSGGHEELISLYDSNKQTAFANGENSPEAIKWKSETTQAVEQLRSEGLNITMGGQSQSGGFFNDLFTSFQNSMGNATNGNGGFDTNGDFSIRTCFTAGTLVHTQTGTKRIEEVTVGDVVLSWNEATGKQEYNRVTETFVKETEEIFTLLFSDGKQLETTWNHPFRRLLPQYKSETLPTKENSEWVAAKDLKEGDLTFTKDGRVLEIGYIQVDDRDEKVYNFSVEKEHDYYVGEDGILVHNEGCDSKALLLGAGKSLVKLADGTIAIIERTLQVGERVLTANEYKDLGLDPMGNPLEPRSFDLVKFYEKLAVDPFRKDCNCEVLGNFEQSYKFGTATTDFVGLLSATFANFKALVSLGDNLLTKSKIYSELGILRSPSRPVLAGEDIILESKLTKSIGSSKFENVVVGEYGSPSKKYLWTIDNNGINLGLEQTTIGNNSVIKHSNLSSQAYSGGEVWFTAENEVHMNAWSGRFGAGANISEAQWKASVDAWKSLGYKVVVEPYFPK